MRIHYFLVSVCTLDYLGRIFRLDFEAGTPQLREIFIMKLLIQNAPSFVYHLLRGK